jgi:HptB-dependent secretion and biofilm anti anti-sigma factor
MEYKIEGTGRRRKIVAAGQFKFGDHGIFGSISEILGLKGIDEVVFDITQLQTIDSVGMGVLIKLNAFAKENGKSFKVTGVTGDIKHLFEIFKMEQTLDII